MKKATAMLTINVKYDVPDDHTPEDMRSEITQLLEFVANHAASNGLLSGEDELIVDEWSSNIDVWHRLD